MTPTTQYFGHLNVPQQHHTINPCFPIIKLTDLDLCQTVDHGCEHQCVSTTDSYICRCFEGFMLAEDGKSCKSMISTFFDVSLLPQNLSKNT